MKTLVRICFFSLVALLLAPSASFASTTLALAQPAPQAPLDRYFGKLAMSPLGILNAIKHVSDRAEAKQVDPASAIAGLALVEDCVKDWEAQFPGDKWLPRVVMSIDRVYSKIDDETARTSARRVDAWLTLRYAGSDEARTIATERDAHDVVADPAYAAKIDPTPAVLKP